MKNIIIKDKKVFICEEIVANRKLDKEIPYYFDLFTLVEAIEKRMESCVNKLQEAYSNQKVFKVGENVIEYEGGYFNIPSYEVMKDTLKFLNNFRDNQYENVASSTLNMLSLAQLNQLKKAYVSYYKEWNLGASIIEEYEMYKLQTQTENNK